MIGPGQNTRNDSVPAISALVSTHRAGNWFLKSGIRGYGGGVARYCRADTGEYQRVSTEITGYAVSTFAYLFQLTGQGIYRTAALQEARFLHERAWDPALKTFPFEWAAGGPPALSYFFDCGIIARGLLAVWRLTGETAFLDLARACGRSMARDFAGDNEFNPVLTLPDKRPLAGNGRWSRRPGCYQLKAAMAWHELFEETGDEDFRRNYEMVLAYSLRNHATFLLEEPERERVMDRLHAYAYFLEGLLPAASRTECARAMADGIEQIAVRVAEIAPLFERSDVYAQLLRLRLLAGIPGKTAEEEASRIAEFQLDDGDPKIGGGFCFGRKGGEFLPFVNPASTAFCLQALEMWREYQTGAFQAGRLDLI